MTRCKMTCSQVTEFKDKDEKTVSVNVSLYPVYASDPESPNHAFWKATPSGRVDLYISNPEAFGAFESGKAYFVDFTETE